MKNKNLVASLMEASKNPDHPDNREIVAIGKCIYPGVVDEAEKLINFLENNRNIADLVDYIEENPPGPMVVGLLALMSVGKYKSKLGRKAANELHSKPGGSKEKHEQIRSLWLSGKYGSRDLCAEQECAALNMSFSSARKALRNI